MNNHPFQASRRVWALRVGCTLGLACTVAFIFANSMQIAAASSARSQQVMRLLNGLLGRVGLGPLSEHLVRKLAHFSEFALLGFCLTLCLRTYTRHCLRHAGWPLFGGLLTANADEFIQINVPGRSSSVRDVFIDLAGVTAGLLAALLLLLLARRLRAMLIQRRRKECGR